MSAETGGFEDEFQGMEEVSKDPGGQSQTDQV